MGKKRNNSKIPSKASQLASKPQNKYEKQQQKYIEKKRNDQKKAPIPKYMTKYELSQAIAQNEELVTNANKRIQMIKIAGYNSLAVDRVSRETGSDYFDLSGISNRAELVREVTRIRVFINDKGSTIEGAKLETAQVGAEQYRGLFGNQYNNETHGFKSFDTTKIDEEVFKRACTTYHQMAETRQGEMANDGGYGSENLIMALYDAELKGKDSLVYGMDLLDTFVKSQTNEFKKVTDKANLMVSISGMVDDNISGGYSF